MYIYTHTYMYTYTYISYIHVHIHHALHPYIADQASDRGVLHRVHIYIYIPRSEA